MTRVALKGMASRPLRTFLTTLAIVLGVGMVSAAFTLTDTMRHAANSLSSAAYDGTGAVVSAHTAFAVDSKDYSIQRPSIAAAKLAEVRSVPQVQTAVGDISDQAKIIGDDGKPVGDGPYFGEGFDSTSGLEVLALLREAVELDRQTTVMVTHDPRAAASADRVLFLADGRVVADLAGPSEDAILGAMRDAAKA